MDRRDDLTWLTLSLTPAGEERVQDGTLAKTLRDELGVGEDFPIFVPASTYLKGQSQVTVILLEGYAFVGSGLPDTTYFRLERRQHVAQVMSDESGRSTLRTPLTISNTEIKALKKKLREQTAVGISVGDEVLVLHGPYRNLEGVVRHIDGDNVGVEILLRSIEVITPIPRVFLEILHGSK